MTRRATTLLAACAIIAAGIAVYSDSFTKAFVLDDAAIKDTAALHSLWPLGPVLAGPRPVVNLTFAVNWAIGGLNVAGYHVVNLAAHILAALVLFGIVRRILSLPSQAERFGPDASALALAVALIWMVHPLQTESVTYIVQRAESLMGLFYLLTLYCAIRSFSEPDRRGRWQAAAVAACALGMGAKPVMVTAPIIVLAYDRLFVAPSVKAALRNSRRLYAGLAAAWLVLAVLATRPAPVIPSAGFGIESLTSWQYARTQFGVIVHYLALSFRPWPLSLDYGWPVASDLSAVLPPALLVLALIGATLAALCRASPLAFPGLWFFLILAPTSSIMPIRDLCVEHRMYLPLAAVVAVVVLGLHALGRRVLARLVPAESRARLGATTGALSCLLVLLFLGGLTSLRNQAYASEETIWRDAARHCPNNPRAFQNLAAVLLNQKRYDESIPFYLRAIELNPNFGPSHNELGKALSELGRYDEAAAQFADGLRLKPDDSEAQCHFGTTLAALGKLTDAAIHYREAIRLKPDFVEAHYDLASALADQGRAGEAISEYEAALKLDPDNGPAHNNLGRLLSLQGRPAGALAHYQAALRLLPDQPVALMNLAWLRATCADSKFRDAAEALRLARRARDQAGAGNARADDVLAAACAESGLFDEAVAAARQAVEAAERSGEKSSAAQIRDRLKLYESRTPYREPPATTASRSEP